MQHGGYCGTNTKHILGWNELKQLKSKDRFGGGWIVTHCKRQKIPRSKNHVFIVKLMDSYNNNNNINDPIQARIWKVPSSVLSIQTDSLLVISPEKACIKEFNSSHIIHVNYQHCQIVAPHHIKSFQKNQNGNPKKKQLQQSSIPTNTKKIQLNKSQSVSFSDLSSPDIDPIQIEKEELKASLGIDDSLAIAHDAKVVYNYAIQQSIQKSNGYLSDDDQSDKSGSILSTSPLKSPSRSKRKRSFTEMDNNININDDQEPITKKQKLMNNGIITINTPQREKIERNRLAAIERLKLHKMNTEIPRVYIVDLETTSFPPNPVSVENGDVIIEIAIVQFNRTQKDLYSIKPVLHCFINPETYDNYPKNWRDAWIFKNGTTISMVEECGMDSKSIIPQIRKILNGHYVTSYCTDFDLNRFLKQEPYNVECKEFECIMKLCGKEMNCINPKLSEAAHEFMGMDYRWGLHNAMEDCLTAAKILSQVVDDP